ncbi:hypothetical protein BDQ17DRAFT_751739 [Cyathus striatus]|nr:hypothetical protein BDQ17DRAFT_751739 [Cyathus striatus]
MSFKNAHSFRIQRAEINDIKIDTQNIYNQLTDEELSPLRTTAACTSQNFVGQEVYLERLHQYFARANTTERKMFLLYGMGGIGKTQICLKFIDEKASQYVNIFWIDITSEDTVIQSLKEIYKKISAAGTSASSFSSAVVLNRISNLESEWLIIYDNADGSPELVEKYIPPGNLGKILITSRNPALSRITSHENSMEVSVMSEETAIELLCKASGIVKNTKDLNDVKIVVEKLHYLPLAIDMAGAYIAQVHFEINDFIKLYEKFRPNILNHDKFKGASGYNRTVYKTWEISFQKILEDSIDNVNKDRAATAQYAITLINICAFLHYEKISKSIFERAAMYFPKHKKQYENIDLPSYLPSMDVSILNMDECGEWDEWLFMESIELLLSFSLINKTKIKSLYNIHPLVQTYCQDRLSVTEKQLWILNARSILVSSICTEDTTAEYIYMNKLLPHVIQNLFHNNKLINPKYYNDIFSILANILRKCDKFNTEGVYRLRIALTYLEKLLGYHETLIDSLIINENMWLNIGQKINSDNLHYNIMVLNALYHLSISYWNQGEKTNGQLLGNKVFDMRKQILGNEHPDTFQSMDRLAYTYNDLGKYKDAEQLEIEVLNMRKQILGNQHPDTLSSMANLAAIYSNFGKYKDAEKLKIEVLNKRKQILGNEHPDTLKSMADLAATYSNLGKHQDAEKLEIEVLDLRKQILGNEHPDTLWSMADLADTYSNLGKHKDAEKLEIEVLDLRKQILGNEHPDTLWSMANIAATYSNLGKHKDAEKLEIEVLDLRKQILGNEHPDTLWSMADLAATYSNLGKHQDAEKLEIEVLDLRKQILGNEHPDTLWSMANLADTYSNLGKHKDAEKLEIEVLDLRKQILGNEHPDTLSSIADLAATYSNLGKHKDAEKLRIEVLNMRKQILGNEHPDTLWSMANLADTYSNLGKHKDAEKLEIEVLDLRKHILGKGHPDTLSSMANLAAIYSNLGKNKDAEKLQIEVLDMRKHIFST